MRKQKYQTEEERLEAKRLYMKQWREKNAEYKKQWYRDNKKRIAEYNKQYYEANNEKFVEYNKQWREANKEKRTEYKKQYYQANKKKIAEYHKQYNKTPMGRAKNLVNNYKRIDKKYNRGECTLTTQWVVDNIFTKKCIYCGESDWRKLGCDRKDNSLPHTPNNVVCCCGECNTKRGTKSFEEFLAECKQKDLISIATS